MKREPWKPLESQEILKNRLFRLRTDRLQLPDGRVMPSYYVIEFPDWVNIIPVTKDRKIVFVEQFRHATGEYTVEVPGGSTDPELGETAMQAAIRELAEETGYTTSRVQFLTRHAPNPALQNNYAHTFIAFDCEQTQPPQPDPFEDIRLVTKTIGETYKAILSGEINHSIIVAAFVHALPFFGVDLAGLK